MTKNDRLDDWNGLKKQIHTSLPINQTIDLKPKFTIRSWSVWWYYIGENIGHEFGSHFHDETSTLIHKRPCVIVSKRNMLTSSKHHKVVILPLSSIKATSKQKDFHHILKKIDYPNIKDSFVLCNEIRTIDVRRLIQRSVDTLQQDDIDSIRTIMKKFIDI